MPSVDRDSLVVIRLLVWQGKLGDGSWAISMVREQNQWSRARGWARSTYCRL